MVGGRQHVSSSETKSQLDRARKFENIRHSYHNKALIEEMLNRMKYSEDLLRA